jgi:hypothetical protein
MQGDTCSKTHASAGSHCVLAGSQAPLAHCVRPSPQESRCLSCELTV